MSKKEVIQEDIRLEKLVHGGQCMASASDGCKLFVWGGLPSELVDVRILRKKQDYYEGIVITVKEPSEHRIEPLEPLSYLSTSPWQIMTQSLEDESKALILEESFKRAGVELDWQDFVSSVKNVGYRNKMEFGFWGDDDGLHLAHYVRGTHGKQIVAGSVLANNFINVAAQSIIDLLNTMNVRAGDLKTVILRCSQAGSVVGALFVKEKLDFSTITLPEELKGMVIYYSNPKSPASVPTELLYSFGDITLSDDILGKNIMYDVLSFFQVNLPVFEQALIRIKEYVGNKPIVDFYSGVGTIGIPLNAELLVESDESNIRMAKLNVEGRESRVIHASSEKATDYIDETNALVVDPPRAGLHQSVIDRILETKPPMIAYLSCNPSTQARDIALLAGEYNIVHAEGFNFFPRTPHIESLVILSVD